MSTHRFVLPRSDGSWLTNPPPDDWTPLIDANRRRLSSAEYDCQGRSLDDLRRWTRQHVLHAAAHDTAELVGDDVAVPRGDDWIVTGHQPDLFHLGVWAKNFAVDRLAQKTQSVGLNLIVDNDRLSATGIAVPVGTRAAPALSTALFDAPRPPRPWEELTLADRTLFETFPQRVREPLRAWGIEPVVCEFWPAAVNLARRTPLPRLAACLAAARIAAERAFGARNLELFLSRLESLPGFWWFTANILARLPQFVELHNAIVHDYRRRNRLRSRTHPVPDLGADREWREAPFWVWRAGDAQRHRVFARQVEGEIELRDQRDVFVRLPLTPQRSACCAVERLAELPGRGIRLRSRALTTTLFARLFLADLFVHGIGGAKYDEMTDELIARFYGLPVPPYATISATVYLPLGGTWDADPQQIGAVAHALWDLEHNPERWAHELSQESLRLAAEKRALIEEQRAAEAAPARRRSVQDRGRNHRRYQRLCEINRLLQRDVAALRRELESRRAELLARRAANRILASREFAWVLFPKSKLHAFRDSLPIS